MFDAFDLHRRRRRPHINITSLIDVMFLLLIFFMVTTTFKEQLGIDVSLPEAETTETHKAGTHEITVTASGEYYFGEQRVDEAGLRASLKELLATNPDAILVLRGDKSADFGRVVRAIDIARDLGGLKLIVPTRHLDEDGRDDGRANRGPRQ